MAVLAKKGTITCPGVTGNQATTGVGFQPQAVIFFVTHQTASGYAAHISTSIGFMVGSTAGHLRTKRTDAQPPGTANSFALGLSTAAVLLNDTAAGSAFVLDAVPISLDADGFTLNFATISSGVIIHYLALAGLDNAFVGSFTRTTAAGAGNQSVTGVGFEPDLLIAVGGPASTNLRMGSSIGVASSSTSRACLAVGEENSAGTTKAYQQQLSDKLLRILSNEADVGTCDLASMDADGFTVNWTTGPVAATATVRYLAIKGGIPRLGVETQGTTTGNKSTAIVGQQPKAALFFSGNAAANAAIDTTQAKFSLGAADGTNEGAIWWQSDDAVATTNANMRTQATKALGMSTANTTTNAEADASFDPAGFTLNWTTADATAREFIYVTLGDSAAPLSPNKSFIYGQSVQRAANW